jgi:uncharacterized SAM-binding protein YcdF (DUF218 family)
MYWTGWRLFISPLAVHFKSFLVDFFLPPFGFVSVALLGLLLLRWTPRLGRCLLWLSLLALLALGTPAVSDRLLAALETGLDTVPPAGDPPRASVILGGDSVLVGGADPGVQIGRLTLERLRAGAALHRRTGLPLLVTGGTARSDGPPVGLLMARSLVEDFRVPVTWTEQQSRDTWENAFDSAAILRGAGIRSVYVVTHPWHMRRALQAFARAGLIATPAPTGLDSALPLYPSDFLPRVGAWQTAFFAMHEWVGRVFYALR